MFSVRGSERMRTDITTVTTGSSTEMRVAFVGPVISIPVSRAHMAKTVENNAVRTTAT